MTLEALNAVGIHGNQVSKELSTYLMNLFPDIEYSFDKNDVVCIRSIKNGFNFGLLTTPTTGLLIIDVQNDFTVGSLRSDMCPAKHSAEVIFPVIHRLCLLPFTKIFASRDYHPDSHISFYENRNNWMLSEDSVIQDIQNAKPLDTVQLIDTQGKTLDQILWPKHCVQGTHGSEFDCRLMLPKHCIDIHKGTIDDVESYSAFGEGRENTGLEDLLRGSAIESIVVCGIAFDYCVAYTALEGAKRGFRVSVVEDACIGISPDTMAQKREEMLQLGIHFTTADKVSELLTGGYIPSPHILQAIKRH